MIAICNYCKQEFDTYTGHYNRAMKLGRPVYCSREHAGFGRRKTKEEKVRLKAEYDKIYSAKNKEKIKLRNIEYRKQPHVKELERLQRKRRSKKHTDYCRKPEYKKWKVEYDLKYNAKKNYGEFWESAIALNKIERNIDNRLAKAENNLITKSQKRKRQWKNKQKDLLQIL